MRVDQDAKALRVALRVALFSRNFALRGKLTFDAAKPVGLPEIYIFPSVMFYGQGSHHGVVFRPSVIKEVAL